MNGTMIQQICNSHSLCISNEIPLDTLIMNLIPIIQYFLLAITVISITVYLMINFFVNNLTCHGSKIFVMPALPVNNYFK